MLSSGHRAVLISMCVVFSNASLHAQSKPQPYPKRTIARLGSPRFVQSEVLLTAAAVAPNGKLFATASHNEILGEKHLANVIRLRETATGRVLRKIVTDKVIWAKKTGIVPRINRLLFSPDSRKLSDGKKIWDVTTGREITKVTRAKIPKWLQPPKRYVPKKTAQIPTVIDKWAYSKMIGYPPLPKWKDGELYFLLASTISDDGEWKAWGLQCFRRAEKPLFHFDLLVVANAATGKIRFQKRGMNLGVHRVRLSPKGKYLVTCDEKGVVTVWETATGRRTVEFLLVNLNLTGFGLGGGFSSSGFSFSSSSSLSQRNTPPRPIPFTAAPDGNVLLFWQGSSFRLWNGSTGQEIGCPVGHGAPLRAVRFSDDGAKLFSADAESRCVWDTRTWQQRQRQHFQLKPLLKPTCFAVAPSHNQCLVQAGKSAVQLQTMTNGKPLNTFKGKYLPHYIAMTKILADSRSARISPHGRRAALVHLPDNDTVVLRFYDLQTRKKPREKSLSASVLQNLVAYSGRLAAWQEAGHKLVVYDVDADKILWRNQLAPKAVGYAPQAVFSADSNYLATAHGHHDESSHQTTTIRIWETATGREIQRLLINNTQGLDPVNDITFSPDNRRLAIANDLDHPLRLYEIASGDQPMHFAELTDTYTAVAFSPDGKRLAVGSEDSTIWVFDVQTHAKKRPQPFRLTNQELLTHWQTLQQPNAEKAAVAMAALVQAPQQTLAFLKQHLKPVTLPANAKLERLIADLDSRRFKIRRSAMYQLECLQGTVEPALQQALKRKLSLEAHLRVRQVLKNLRAPKAGSFLLRQLRCLEVLERIGSPAAKRLVQTLGQGDDRARITRTARVCLQRIQ